MEYHHFRKKCIFNPGPFPIAMWVYQEGSPQVFHPGLGFPGIHGFNAIEADHVPTFGDFVDMSSPEPTENMQNTWPKYSLDSPMTSVLKIYFKKIDGEWWRDIPSSTGWNRGFPSRIPTYSFLLPSPRTLFMPFHSFPSPRNPSFQDCLANHTYNVACLVLNPFLEPTTCRTCQQAVMSSCELVGSGKTW